MALPSWVYSLAAGRLAEGRTALDCLGQFPPAGFRWAFLAAVLVLHCFGVLLPCAGNAAAAASSAGRGPPASWP
eukprot:6865936-Lingulodinium_polyedra.AAC.1